MPLREKLNSENRWVNLSEIIPLNNFAQLVNLLLKPEKDHFGRILMDAAVCKQMIRYLTELLSELCQSKNDFDSLSYHSSIRFQLQYLKIREKCADFVALLCKQLRV